MTKAILLTILIIFALFLAFFVFRYLNPATVSQTFSKIANITPTPPFPLNIQAMRARSYPGSNIVVEQELEPGSNYERSIASYQSDGLKIYGLLTIPQGTKPEKGWPVIVFNHGYIPPEQYRTTERYIAYVDSFARNGYIVFRPDYRGHGESEGIPEGAYYSPAYTVDVLNAVSSVKKHPDANPERVGMWGHSLGGNIALRSIVTTIGDIKAAVIWGGVLGSYDDLVNRWHRAVPYRPSPRELALRNSSRQKIIEQYGSPSANLDFWNSIDPTAHIADIMTPVQIHHGTSDEEVPVAFAQSLYDKLKKAGKIAELYTYDGGDHNISDPFFTTAMDRSIEFFDKYLKK
jgi:dipeptidyl aminopeptidase/acylaminoacyl peptidase